MSKTSTESFWRGFTKRASEDPLQSWTELAADLDKKNKKKDYSQVRTDPVAMSRDYADDARRYWP